MAGGDLEYTEPWRQAFAIIHGAGGREGLNAMQVERPDDFQALLNLPSLSSDQREQLVARYAGDGNPYADRQGFYDKLGSTARFDTGDIFNIHGDPETGHADVSRYRGRATHVAASSFVESITGDREKMAEALNEVALFAAPEGTMNWQAMSRSDGYNFLSPDDLARWQAQQPPGKENRPPNEETYLTVEGIVRVGGQVIRFDPDFQQGAVVPGRDEADALRPHCGELTLCLGRVDARKGDETPKFATGAELLEPLGLRTVRVGVPGHDDIAMQGHCPPGQTTDVAHDLVNRYTERYPTLTEGLQVSGIEGQDGPILATSLPPFTPDHPATPSAPGLTPPSHREMEMLRRQAALDEQQEASGQSPPDDLRRAIEQYRSRDTRATGNHVPNNRGRGDTTPPR